MTYQEPAVRRLLLSVDAKGYGGADGRRQAGMQRGLIELLDGSAQAAGLNREEWERQPAGDGELAILPPTEPENIVVDTYVRELTERLDAYNRDRVDGARLRLRLAVHHGMALRAANGFSGQGVVVVSRLVESVAARRAQTAAPAAALVVVLSNQVYLDTVAQGHTVLRPNQFRAISAQVKEFSAAAWLYVPGHDTHHLDLGEEEPISEEQAPEPERSAATGRVRAEVVNYLTVSGNVTTKSLGSVHHGPGK